MPPTASASEPNLVTLVREAATAASEAGSAAASRRGKSGRSQAKHSTRSSASGLSRSRSAASGSMGGAMTLNGMQDHVNNQAMERYKKELVKDAVKERQVLEMWENQVRTNVDDERLEADIRKARERRNQDELIQQIESNKNRRATERKEFIENASSHAYPLFSETFICHEEVERIRKAQRDQWREDLNHQRVTQELLKNIEEVRFREHVKAQKAKHLSSMQKERGLEVQRLRRQGQDLVTAWDKEVQLKAFRKAVLAGKESPVPGTPGAPYA